MSEEAVNVEAQTESVSTGNGLFGEVASTPAATAQEPEAAQAPGQVMDWHWSDGIKGEGERPEWLKERYKSVSDQAAAYSELEKKFGEFRGAPKDGYDLSGIEGIDKDSPILNGMKETLKELNLSQAGFERLVGEYAEYQKTAYQTDLAEEIKKLGPGAAQQIQQSKQWMENNLPADVQSTIHTWIQTAEDMRAFEVLRSFQPLSKSPNAQDMTSSLQYESLQAVKNEKTANWSRYKEDENYRRALSERMRMAELRSSR